MGTDIHVYIEVKMGGKWHLYNQPKISRDYDLFARICGVRANTGSGVRPIAPDRGVPEDASTVVKAEYEYEDSDIHSATWLSWVEAAKLQKDFPPSEGVFRDLFDYILQDGIEDDESWGRVFEDVRVIVWFDN